MIAPFLNISEHSVDARGWSSARRGQDAHVTRGVHSSEGRSSQGRWRGVTESTLTTLWDDSLRRLFDVTFSVFEKSSHLKELSQTLKRRIALDIFPVLRTVSVSSGCKISGTALDPSRELQVPQLASQGCYMMNHIHALHYITVQYSTLHLYTFTSTSTSTFR